MSQPSTPPTLAAPEPVPSPLKPVIAISRVPTGPDFSRQLTVASLLLVLVPALVEFLAMKSRGAPELAAPASLLPPLVLSACLPYCTLAVCCAALAWVWSRREVKLGALVARNTLFLLAALLVGLSAARARPSLDEVLLGEVAHHVEGSRLLFAGAGPLAVSVPVSPSPIGAVEDFGVVTVAEARAPSTPLESAVVPTSTRVAWYAYRYPGRETLGKVELVGAGQRIDLTPRLSELRPGESRFFSHELPLLAPGAQLELRPVGPPLTPVRFFVADFRPGLGGFALESGNGNTAAVVDTRAEGARAAGMLVVRGTQQPGGYSVAIVAGSEWEKKDLRELARAQGSLELDLEGEAVPPFLVKLTAQAGETGELPLWHFTREPLGAGRWRYRFPLDKVEWKGVPREAVVGLALVHVGATGPFELRLERAAVVPSESRTGVGILGVASATPGARPVKALLVAGPPVDPAPLLTRQLPRRGIAALLLLLGAVGWAALRNSFVVRPLASLLAFLTGPAFLFTLDALLPRLEGYRPEYGGLALGSVALALGTAAALRGMHAEPPPREADGSKDDAKDDSKNGAKDGAKKVSFTSMDALKTVAMVGIIGIHVTVDAGGGPYVASAPAERLWPLLLRGLMRPFDIAIFITSSFFLLAHSLERGSRPYGEQVLHRLKRLMVPFLFWSLFYLAFRFAKASAFGYTAAHVAELSQPASWLKYAVLGSAQYHLHFLPFLASLTLLYPLARPLAKKPAAAGVALLGLLLGWYFLDGLLYSVPMDPGLREYLQRGTKTLGYVGFVVLGFTMYQLVRGGALEGRRWVWMVGATTALALCAAPLLHHVLMEAELGEWLPPTRIGHMGRHLLMAASFVLFAVADKVRWPARVVAWGGLTFGVFLVHPAILDLLEIAERGVDWSPLTRTLVNFGVTTVLSFTAVWLLARVQWLRWTIGLDRTRA